LSLNVFRYDLIVFTATAGNVLNYQGFLNTRSTWIILVIFHLLLLSLSWWLTTYTHWFIHATLNLPTTNGAITRMWCWFVCLPLLAARLSFLLFHAQSLFFFGHKKHKTIRLFINSLFSFFPLRYVSYFLSWNMSIIADSFSRIISCLHH